MQSTPRETYIAAVEEACTRFPPGRQRKSGWNPVIYSRKTAPPPKPNITLKEQRAIRELKEDQSQVILTADKGWPWLSWTGKTTWIRPNYYWLTPILTSPSPRTLPTNSKTNIPKHSGTSKTREDSKTTFTEKCTPTSAVAQKFYGLTKIHKNGTPSVRLPGGGPSHMEWLSCWKTSSTPWLANPLTISKTLTTSYSTSKR